MLEIVTFYDDVVITFSPLLWRSDHVRARYYKRETESGHVRKTDKMDVAYIRNLSGFYSLLGPKHSKTLSIE